MAVRKVQSPRKPVDVLQAAGLLLVQWLASAKPGQLMFGIHPVTHEIAEQSRTAVAVAALQSMMAFANVSVICHSSQK